MPPEPTRRMREERMAERREGERAEEIPRRIGGVDDVSVMMMVWLDGGREAL